METSWEQREYNQQKEKGKNRHVKNRKNADLALIW